MLVIVDMVEEESAIGESLETELIDGDDDVATVEGTGQVYTRLKTYKDDLKDRKNSIRFGETTSHFGMKMIFFNMLGTKLLPLD